MKRILAILSPLIFLGFVACGGSDPSTPPPAATSPVGNQTLGTMQSQLATAQQTCSSSFAPAIAAALSAQQQGASNPAILALMAQGNSSNCSNTLMNVLAQATRVDNGQWIQNPQSKLWMAMQVAAIMNMTAQRAGVNPQAALNLPLSQFAQQSLIPSLTPGTGVAPNVLSQAVGQYAH